MTENYHKEALFKLHMKKPEVKSFFWLFTASRRQSESYMTL